MIKLQFCHRLEAKLSFQESHVFLCSNYEKIHTEKKATPHLLIVNNNRVGFWKSNKIDRTFVFIFILMRWMAISCTSSAKFCALQIYHFNQIMLSAYFILPNCFYYFRPVRFANLNISVKTFCLLSGKRYRRTKIIADII